MNGISAQIVKRIQGRGRGSVWTPKDFLDHAHGAIYPTACVTGRPTWGRWLGLKLKGKTTVPVTTFRCPRCGRLESFAHPDSSPA